jgi:hypothetical protein
VSTFLESFVLAYYKPVCPSAERLPSGGWVVRVPIGEFLQVELSGKDIAYSKTDYRGFLESLVSKVDKARADYETGRRDALEEAGGKL